MTYDLKRNKRTSAFYFFLILAFPLLSISEPNKKLDKQSVSKQKNAQKMAFKSKAKKPKKKLKSNNRVEQHLLKVKKQASSHGKAFALDQLKKEGGEVKGEDVVVIIQCDPSEDPKTIAKKIGDTYGTVIRTSRTHIKASIPLDQLENVANEIPGVSFIRSPIRPKAHNSIITEGKNATAANTWHANGITGKNVKIAVIDGGFAGISTRKSQGELPASAIEVDFSGEGMQSGSSTHGTACAEIIYDMAPDCQLYLLKTWGMSDDEAAKDYCKANGIDIISYSLGYSSVNFYDGTASSSFTPHPVSIVNDAQANGILWITSAGNEQYHHAMETWRDTDQDRNLDWDAGVNFNELWNGGDPIPVGAVIDISLTWNKWPTTNQDFDLDLYYWDGSEWDLVDSSEYAQDGSYIPEEWIYHTVEKAGDYAFAIYSTLR